MPLKPTTKPNDPYPRSNVPVPNNPLRDELLRDALLTEDGSGLFGIDHWRAAVFVSFTLKQCIETDETKVFLDYSTCTKQFKRFMDRLNRSVYKNAFRHHGKRLRVLPVVEKRKKGRWHIHALIEPPHHMPRTDFKDEIRHCWLWQNEKMQNPWAYRQMEILTWVDKLDAEYLLKFEQKDGLEAWSDSIDWYSFNNPGSSSV